ncbi:UNVERIFIED_CONTAM: Auxin-induced protein 15A [Sesamum calycinum]|uniref:Auxin-induced protein 15A n=1 Tax=Sesamum calycinum TaxID=2727403 RepID=A0AAW2NU73_9LAMI
MATCHTWPKVPRSGRACGGISPAVSRRLRSSNVYCDSDEDSCQSPEPPHDVPRGYLAVYVGPELRRFIIPTSYLTDPLFKVLLEKVEEEFGFDHSGGSQSHVKLRPSSILSSALKITRKSKLTEMQVKIVIPFPQFSCNFCSL